MTAMAPSWPMSNHVGEMTLRMMSAANSNSRPSSSHTPYRCQTALRAPWVARLPKPTPNRPMNASSDPAAITRTATASTASATYDARFFSRSSIHSHAEKG